MVTPVLNRVPPPPNLAINDPALNKWLIDLTAFINSGGGGIDPALIPGYDALIATVNALSIQVANNTIDIAANTSDIGTLNSEVAALTANVATNTADIATLTARNVVLNGTAVPGAGLGNDGDWYAKTSATAHIYVKVTGAWVLIV